MARLAGLAAALICALLLATAGAAETLRVTLLGTGVPTPSAERYQCASDCTFLNSLSCHVRSSQL